MSAPRRPPWIFARLLETLLPPGPRSQEMLGDLHEEFVRRSPEGRLKASLWYAREAAGVAVRYMGRGSGGRGRSAVTTLFEVNGWEAWMDTLARNLRYALRRLRTSPFFTLIAVVSLALGIGANTAIFSLVNAVIIREKPFEDPDRLVDVYQSSEGFSHGTLSYPDYEDLREASTDVFEAVGGGQLAALQADVEGGVELLLAEAATGNYFELLGVDAARGRLLGDEDHVARGAHPVVVLSHGYWLRRFAADPDAVGSDLRLGGRPYTVVGVAPEEFRGSLRGLEPDVWVPIMMVDELQGFGGNTIEARGNQSFFARGRLRPGATVAQAEAVVDRIAARLRDEHPSYWSADEAFVLEPTDEVVLNPMVDRFLLPAAAVMMGVVGLVLLIACANLASFLLARAADRRKEIAVRLALGSGRRALVWQLLTESLLLAALGGVLGVVLASVALDALVGANLPLPLPITFDLSLDRTVLAFSVLLSVVAGIFFGLIPALQSTRPDLAPTLRDETAGGGGGRGAFLRNALVTGQVAVSVVLLVGAGLFLRSLDASRSIDPGFGEEPTGLLQLTVPADRYDGDEALAYLDRLTESIGQLPGVRRVGLIDNLHLNQLSTQMVRVRVEGVDAPPGREDHAVDYAAIDEDFLETAGIDLVAGRDLAATDREDGEEVVLVNEAFQRRFYPGERALGRSFELNGEPTRIVGVTEDHKVRQLGETPRPFVYRSIRQSLARNVTVLATTSGDAEALAVDMMVAARDMDPAIMITDTKTMERHLDVVLLGRELGALVVGAFALLALVLASIGVYGVVSYAVARRVHEVGIRLSLGADVGRVVRMLTRQGLVLAGSGIAFGLLLAALAAQLVSRLLYGVPPLDPVTFVGVPVTLGVVALLASWIPARRVTAVDPAQALRAE